MKLTRSYKGLIFALFVLAVACFLIPLEKAIACDLDHQNNPPSMLHILGTDELGRDMLYRSMYALKISLSVGVAATIIDMIMGAFFGILSSLMPPPFSNIVARFLDVMTILPQMLLSILILMLVKNGFYSLIIAISLTGWIPTARALRAEMLKVKNMDFISALKGIGFSQKHILFKHMIPTVMPTLLVSSALCLPSAIFSEAFMSFLGLGIAPPSPSLGNMISDGLAALNYYPWRLIVPATLVFCLIFILTSLIDKLKTKLKEVL